MRLTTTPWFLCLAAGAIACMHHASGPAPSPAVATPSGRLEGSVTYLSRIALPAGSIIRVTLADTSTGGMRWTQVITTGGENVPVHFSVSYDASLIVPGHSYFAVASIQSGSRLTFASPTWVPALGPGASTSIILELRAPDPLSGIWIRPIPTQETRTEGIDLTPQGDLVLINICSMRGDHWRRSGDTLVIATSTDRYPDPVFLRATVRQLEDSVLVIERGGGYFAGRWSHLAPGHSLADDCAH
ncbi:MAG: YbaY family lipoprotein [Gemmatimonadales bacterium]